MQELIYKVFDNFDLSWNTDVIESKIIETIVNPLNPEKPFSQVDGRPHWQFFPKTNIYFARNFYLNFRQESDEIIFKLNKIQQSLKHIHKSILLDVFLKEKFIPYNLTIIKILPNTDVYAHTDQARNFALNIGLKNSSNWTTVISHTLKASEFDNHEQETYVLKDGQGLMVDIKFAHKVITTIPSSSPRYVITYNFLK